MTSATGSAATELDEHAFDFLRSFLLARSAHALGCDKHYLVISRLSPLAHQLGIDSVSRLLHHMRETKDANIERSVVEAMTTNETLWFRDAKPFEALRRHIVPEVIGRNEGSRQLSVWSAAASTGQELYSVALVLKDGFPELDSWSVTLKGTDINTSVIERARAGRFSTLEINRGLAAHLLVRHFTREGAHYVISETIRKMVSFSYMNLATRWPTLPRFDVIFLRNVLIYFDRETKTRVIELCARQLTPGGYLLLGPTDSLIGSSTGLTSRTIEGAVVYQNVLE